MTKRLCTHQPMPMPDPDPDPVPDPPSEEPPLQDPFDPVTDTPPPTRHRGRC